MRNIIFPAAALALVTVAAPAQVATGQASGTSYKCTSSAKSLDMPQYSGPWPDNYDITVTVCARRTGAVVASYATIRWEAPRFTAGQVDTFNAATIRTEVKRSVGGADPIAASGTYDVHARMEKGSGNYTTPTVHCRLGRARGLGDVTLFLDWKDDGKAARAYQFSASPVV